MDTYTLTFTTTTHRLRVAQWVHALTRHIEFYGTVTAAGSAPHGDAYVVTLSFLATNPDTAVAIARDAIADAIPHATGLVSAMRITRRPGTPVATYTGVLWLRSA